MERIKVFLISVDIMLKDVDVILYLVRGWGVGKSKGVKKIIF